MLLLLLLRSSFEPWRCCGPRTQRAQGGSRRMLRACVSACCLSVVTNVGKRRKMLLLRWESNRTFTACRAGALTTRLRRSLSFSAYQRVIVPHQRTVVLACEGDRYWCYSCYSYVRRSNPGGAADPEHSGHRAVAEGCCVRAWVRAACRWSPM